MRGFFRPAVLTATLVMAVFGARQFCAAGSDDDPKLADFARQATAEHEGARSTAIAALRRAGPAGLEALWAAHEETIDLMRAGATPEDPRDVAAWERIRQALDAVGGQKDCYTSRLFWYTNWNKAIGAARKAKKPILSLHMLGQLTDEYSCANSRFFRATLYANAEVSRVLRERFILHWESVRPVPIVTIDFGDGRTLQRTVTGNSVHYILDANCRPIDALPGLYGPKAFLAGIGQAERICQQLAAASGGRADMLKQYHQDRLHELTGRWLQDQLAVADSEDYHVKNLAPAPSESGSTVQAIQSAYEDYSGCSVRILTDSPAQALQNAVALFDPKLLEPASDELWAKIARLHSADGQLDAASRRVINRQNPAGAAGAIAITKKAVERPIVRMLDGLQQSVALDTVKNEYLLHRRIHEWFSQQPEVDLIALNLRVYAELFLTPSSDPWLGLLQPDSYSGLERGGVVIRQASKP